MMKILGLKRERKDEFAMEMCAAKLKLT